jgi:hypothetical protein
MVKKVASAIIDCEAGAILDLRYQDKNASITLYVFRDFEAHDDPSLVRQQKIGIFGWQEFAVVAE